MKKPIKKPAKGKKFPMVPDKDMDGMKKGGRPGKKGC